jgi:hypothetical protein
MSDQRAELLKWAFAFWLGQILALAVIFRAMQGEAIQTGWRGGRPHHPCSLFIV